MVVHKGVDVVGIVHCCFFYGLWIMACRFMFDYDYCVAYFNSIFGIKGVAQQDGAGDA